VLLSIVHDNDNWLNQPEEYQPEVIEAINKNRNTYNVLEKYPDIILILNESFFDLSVYNNIQTDLDYLADFYSVEGATYGYAIAPYIGGGTNDSEFELLTS
jgi:hypothetical protein